MLRISKQTHSPILLPIFAGCFVILLMNFLVTAPANQLTPLEIASHGALFDMLTSLFLRHQLLWKFANSIIVFLFCIFLAGYTSSKRNFYLHFFIAVLFFFLLPTATSDEQALINANLIDLWPLTAVIIGFLPIYAKVKTGRELAPFDKLLSILLLIFACSQKKIAIAFCLLMLGVLFYASVRFRKIPRFFFFPFAVSVLGMLKAVLAHGNRFSLANEASKIMPAFNQTAVFDKLEYGFLITCRELFFHANLLVLVFFVVLCYRTWINRKPVFLRVSGLLLLAGHLSISTVNLARDLDTLSPVRSLLEDSQPVMAQEKWIFLFLILCTCCLIFSSFRTRRKGTIAAFLFLIGLSASMLSGFSPDVLALGFQNFLPIYTAVLIITLLQIGRKKGN